ncbi:transglutaminase [Hydrogenophaga crassostreae]|uniref:Transglutaminase n=1 Tax=Hydrogenophaga crassostreae TaxID=1763535 RepID=A0A162SUL0_9BURK|nr:transglutaminase family protein [Hydrogenophaga crassostreae]AOW12606.1 transglutaminase [Hydrogenophaga crassostreae]OAD40477.1 transglutaminase [Hydrogenophaga crassostreae]
MTPHTEALSSPSPLLDFEHPEIQRLIRDRRWLSLSEHERTGRIYDFVRNEIAFGYNERDNLPASRVLADGMGQCNTKGTLLMALLRATGIACRLHGFTIDKALQKGAVTGMAYHLAPAEIVHSWVEVQVDGQWLNLEGFILDQPYLHALQQRFPEARSFSGFGAATPNLQSPAVEWRGTHTYIQKAGICQDLGVYVNPDSFYAQQGGNLSGVKSWLYRHIIRKGMNRNVARIRLGSAPPARGQI